MINIIDKRDCCGCTACKSICPKYCIRMESDSEGFLYPHVDITTCINCGLCEKVCPVLHPFAAKTQEPIPYACKSLNNELILKSSSGGLFSVISKTVLSKDGVVFGAAFDSNWGVHHISVDNYEAIAPLRESKYTQSDLGDSFNEIKSLLSAGKQVLFTGTPCQVAGLNHFLEKDHHKDNLITIDVICHSCPSPTVWKEYLSYIERKNGNRKVSSVSFRDKEFRGWVQYSLRISIRDEMNCKEKVVVRQTSQANLYMQGFLNDLYCRPSCSDCPARNYKSGSDITLGDCWGVDKYYDDVDDGKGLSVALLNTKKGEEVFESIKDKIFYFLMKYPEVEPTALHAPLTKNTGPHPLRSVFFSLKDKVPINILIYSCLTPVKIWRTFLSFTKRSTRKIIGKSNYDHIKNKIRR